MSTKFLRWSHQQGLAQGIFWITLACIFGVFGDINVRLVGTGLPALQITFCRFAFGTLVLLPVIWRQGTRVLTCAHWRLHLVRILVGFSAIALWIHGASQTTLQSITTISFVCPILVLPLAYLFLGEHSSWQRIGAVLAGFIGVIIIATFEASLTPQTTKILGFHPGIIFLFLSAILFAFTDILNKKMLAVANLWTLLFYFYCGAALVSLIPALLVWKSVSIPQFLNLLALGSGGSAMLYCILKATAATEVSALAPYKYLELPLAILVGYLIFDEVIKAHTLIGALLIIPSAIFVAYTETKAKSETN